jgi:hypothetical protein
MTMVNLLRLDNANLVPASDTTFFELQLYPNNYMILQFCRTV